MARFSLVPYSIRVKERRTNKYVPLSNISTNSSVSGVDLLELIHHYLDNIVSSLPNNPDEDEILRVDFVELSKRGLNGRLKCGGRGYSSELVDTKTGNIDYQRTTLHAEIIPYYFLTAIPLKAHKGIIIFQKFKNLGIKDLFFDSFYRYFKDTFGNDYILEINLLVPSDLAKQYLKSRVLKIRLIKQGFPRDVFDVDSSAFPNDEEFEGETEMVFKPKKNGYLPQFLLDKISTGIDKFFSSDDQSIGSVIEVNNFEFDNIKIEVKVGNNIRTIDLSDLNRLRYYEDISGIATDINGHPKFDIIDERAKEFLQNLALSVFRGKVDV